MMLPIRELERYLEHTPPELRDIVLQIRDLVLSAAPSATEAIRRRDITYLYAERGGPVSAGICQVSVYADHVRLAFIHGALLPDPMGLLRGEPRYKRYMRLESYDGAPWEAVRDLIRASASFEPRTLTPHYPLAAAHLPLRAPDTQGTPVGRAGSGAPRVFSPETEREGENDFSERDS